jgi:hypothetical protein
MAMAEKFNTGPEDRSMAVRRVRKSFDKMDLADSMSLV